MSLALASVFACSSGGSSGIAPADGGADGSPSKTRAVTSSRGEQANGACSAAPRDLTGQGAVGSTCFSYGDCRPSCCNCDDAGRSYLAAACIDNRCADKADACYAAKSAGFCPGESTPTEPGTVDPPKDPPVPVTGTTICVAGYSSDCDDVGEKWTGTKCCVSNVTLCTDGFGSDCDDVGEHWTGSKCCITGAKVICEAGFASDCDDPGEHWTGSMCCVENVTQCVAGFASDCDDPGEHWTGSKCCL